jgi:hypothetical protein
MKTSFYAQAHAFQRITLEQWNQSLFKITSKGNEVFTYRNSKYSVQNYFAF